MRSVVINLALLLSVASVLAQEATSTDAPKGLLPVPDDSGDLWHRPASFNLDFTQVAQGFEAYYDVAIAPAAQRTFDVQVHDTALPDTDTAVVLGVRLNLSF